jgi:hypothetical protein
MENLMEFTVHNKDGTTEKRTVSVRSLCLGRASSRDPADVKKHVEKVRATGAAIYNVPNFCRKSRYLLTSEDVIEVQERRTAPEVEYVLIADGDEILVSVGSDNNDATLIGLITEALGTVYDTAKSKQLCPASVAKSAWLYKDVKDHWDELRLKSHVRMGGKDVQYQDFQVTQMRAPEAFFKAFPSLREDGTVFFSGSAAGVPSVPPNLFNAVVKDGLFPDNFHFSMHDPVLGGTISHAFRIEHLEWPDSEISP